MEPAAKVLPHEISELRALNGSFATVVFDPEWRIVRANNRFLKMFGYELREIVGRDETLFVASPDTSLVGRGGAPRLCGGQKRTATVRCARRNGSMLWAEVRYTAIDDAEGRLVEIVAIVSDVTAQQLRTADDRGQVKAINLSQAVVHFAPDGTILDANPIFLEAMGYALDEVVGRHHRIFVDPDEAASAAYDSFWTQLARGGHQAAEYRRIGKEGRAIWLQATYNPIFDPAGRMVKVVEYATDITLEKLRQAEYQWQIAAIHKSQAVIAFDMNGTILDANEAFLAATGYRLEEIRGRHHRMFVDPSYAHGAEYAEFWRLLKAGCHHAGQYRRIGKGGRDVWLQATYNPIFDMSGQPIRVVKYASVVTQEKLRQAEHQGQIAAIHRSQAVIHFALDGTILDANDNFLDTVGYRYVDVLGKHHRMFVGAAEAESEVYARFWSNLAQGEHRSGEFKRIGKDGREIWLQATYTPIFDMNGRPFKVVKYATDITQEKLLQAGFRGQIEAIRRSQSVVELALDGTILDANENFLSTFGYTLDEIRGHQHDLLVEPAHRNSADYAAFWDTLRQGRFHSGLYKRIGKDGREIWLQASYNPILDLNGEPATIFKFATDVTSNVAMAEAFEDAKRQAQHDPATSLPNRTRLASFMASALPHPQARLSVLYIDLDRFKPINDRHGHPVGDRVLGEVADRLRRLLRDDQIVARVGGDEFVIAAPDLSDVATEALCQRILEAVAAPIRHGSEDLKLSASVGVAFAPEDAASPDELLRCADLALYRSKEEGRATYSFYATEKNERIAAHRNLADDMRRGIAAGEFFLEYQPRFDTRTREVRSVEALVRWAHPERGRIAPADFVPLAERSGLIVPMGEQILREACRTVAAFVDIGVSVNVSPVQFRDDGLVDAVASALADAGLPGSRLELEITEGVLLEDASRARAVLDELKALGVSLAMDDFGTGYSSMSYLCDYPFDVIKIDRKFVSGIEGSGSGRAVVHAILGLGRALGLSVTAEGVETNAQLAALTHDHCPEVQGFLLARPMEGAELKKLIGGADAATAGAGSSARVRTGIGHGARTGSA